MDFRTPGNFRATSSTKLQIFGIRLLKIDDGFPHPRKNLRTFYGTRYVKRQSRSFVLDERGRHWTMKCGAGSAKAELTFCFSPSIIRAPHFMSKI